MDQNGHQGIKALSTLKHNNELRKWGKRFTFHPLHIRNEIESVYRTTNAKDSCIAS